MNGLYKLSNVHFSIDRVVR